MSDADAQPADQGLVDMTRWPDSPGAPRFDDPAIPEPTEALWSRVLGSALDLQAVPDDDLVPDEPGSADAAFADEAPLDDGQLDAALSTPEEFDEGYEPRTADDPYGEQSLGEEPGW